MAMPSVLEHVMKHPSLYLPRVEFDIATAFLQGYNLASSGGLLSGFHEWLVVKLGYGNNLAWSELVLQFAFPDSQSPRQLLMLSGEHERTVELLFILLETFWQERQQPRGLGRIYIRYQEWLTRQDWYDPSSRD